MHNVQKGAEMHLMRFRELISLPGHGSLPAAQTRMGTKLGVDWTWLVKFLDTGKVLPNGIVYHIWSYSWNEYVKTGREFVGHPTI